MQHLKVEKINGISHEILKCMYKEATPSADFDFLLKMYEGHRPTWCKDYILRRSRQLGIFHTRCEFADCNKVEKIAIAGIIKDIVPAEK